MADGALSMVAGGREAGVTAVGAGGGGVDVSGGALKAAVLAVGSLVMSVQPAILVLATKVIMVVVVVLMLVLMGDGDSNNSDGCVGVRSSHLVPSPSNRERES